MVTLACVPRGTRGWTTVSSGTNLSAMARPLDHRWLAKLLAREKMTHQQLADKLGLERSYVTRMIRGERPISSHVLLQLVREKLATMEDIQ